ncbi:MAG: prepilin peptidase [Pseudomonadaceae bacterium]|nr:prepilin peptidase [Pseudomonadaceae bacterium]
MLELVAIAEQAHVALGHHWPWLAVFLGAVLGGVAGSFLACARHRLPRGQSLWQPPSHCPACRRTLGISDLIPVISWLALRGRCRTCQAVIPAASLLGELVAVIVGALLGWAVGLHLYTVPLVVAALSLLSAAVLWLTIRR